jgi:HK97 family phage major capsid protein/HK97 family phage prohead protease
MDKIQKFKKATLKRSFLIDSKPNLEDRTVELAFSSDVELVRWAGMAEVLSHAPDAVDLTRLNNGAPLLFNHDMDEVIGVVENARIDADGKGRAVVRFSRSDDGEEVWQDVQDGILRSVSVGYKVNEIVLTGEHDGIEVYTATKWEPYEISIVTVPADITVGLGRSMVEEGDEETPAEVLEPIALEAETLLKQICEPTQSPIQTTIMSETKSDGIAAEKSRADIILNAGEKYNEVALASEFVRSGKSADEFKTALLEKVQARQSSVQTSAAKIGLSDKESRDFSMVKLFRSLSEPQNSKAREEAAFELEACAAAADRSGRSLKGTLIPFDVLSVRNTNTISDVIATSGYTGTGKNLVATNLLSGSFVDALRNKTVLMQKATVLAGLVGNVDIPKQTTKTSATWIGEDSSAVQSDIDFGLISLRPKTLAARSEITRRLLNQSSIGVEALVRDDLAKSLALALDYAGFYGDGSSNAPIGINSTSGIGFKGFVGTNPTFAELVDMETAVALENADVQSMAYIAGAGFRGYAKGTKKFASTGADATIWEAGNMVNGYEAVTTNQVAAGDVFFGDFSSLICAIFSGVEVIVDPYTNSASGRIRLVSMLDADFGVRRAKSFVVGRID